MHPEVRETPHAGASLAAKQLAEIRDLSRLPSLLASLFGSLLVLFFIAGRGNYVWESEFCRSAWRTLDAGGKICAKTFLLASYLTSVATRIWNGRAGGAWCGRLALDLVRCIRPVARSGTVGR